MLLTVVGLGSELSGDDAIGLVLVEKLRGRLEPSTTVECVLWPEADALTVAHELIALRTTVLLVDCAEMGLAPTEHRLMAREDVRVRLKRSPISVHGIGLAEGLELAERLGAPGRAIHLFGVQPVSLEAGAPLSAQMSARLPELLEALEEIVLASDRCGEDRVGESATRSGVPRSA